MKTVKNSFVTFFSLFLIFISVLATISCEIGLGASVDTEPPKFEIAYPPIDSVIRGNFAIGGTWSDDGVIAGVTVSIKKTDSTTDEVHELAGSLVTNKDSNDGTWRVIVEPKAEDGTINFTDGSYQATVVIKDSVDRTTTQITTFAIDNTAPVIVLTRPSTAADTESSSFDTYGQTFNLEGQAADTNNVSLIEVKIYTDPECTEESYVYTKNLYNVPNSINMDVAKFEKGNTENDYYQIYKDSTTDGGAKKFYCRIIAYDGAQRFPIDGEQTAEDTKGNSTEEYYLYKDIATSILQPYKITEVYSILNGTFKEGTSARSINSTDVLALLNKSKRTTGRFTLNPKNNPTYMVSGRSPLVLDGTDFVGMSNNASDGTQIVIDVAPGLDGILIEEKSIAVYAVECDASGNKTGSPIALDFTKEESGTSYRLIAKIDKSKGLLIGHNYLIYVSGYDQATSPNPIEPVGKAYGFRMASSGRAPVLEITEPALVTDYTNNTKQTFKGAVTVEDGIPAVVITYNSKEYQINSYTSSEAVGTDTKYYFTWVSPEFENKNASHKFEFKGVLDTESQPVERTIVFDKDKPEINNLKIDEAKLFVASKEDGSTEEGRYLNGTVNATIDISDTYDKIASASYKFIINNNEAAATEVAIDEKDLPKFAFPAINTKNYADGTSLTIKVTAKDRAGNPQTFSENFIINQETDKPWIWPKYYDEISLRNNDITTAKANGKSVITAGTNLEVRIYDDDGVNKNLLDISVKRSNKITENNEDASSWTDEEWTLVDDVVSFRVPDDGGYYKYKIEIKDKANNKTNDVEEFVIHAARAAASITSITRTPTYIRNKAGQSFTITIDGVSSQGPYTLYRKLEAPGLTEAEIKALQFTEVPSTQPRNDFPITDTIEITSGSTIAEGTKVYYYVNDSTRDSNKDKFVSLIFDDVKPTVEIISPASDDDRIGVSAITDNSFSFSGEAEDTLSQVETLYYAFTDSGTAPAYSEDNLTAYTSKASGNGSFIIPRTLSNYSEGRWYLHIIAKDKAGNLSETATTRRFDVDKSKPSLEYTVIEDDTCKSNDAGTVYYFNNGLKGTLTANDSAGNVKVEFKAGDTTLKTLDSVNNTTATDWTLTSSELASIPENVNTTITIVVTDWADKVTSNSFTVVKDKRAPTVEPVNPGNIFTTTAEITGTVSDPNGIGVEKVMWSTSKTGEYSESITPTNGSWKWTIPSSVITDGGEGQKTFWFKAKDKIGNETNDNDAKEVSFLYDSAVPGLEIDSEFVAGKQLYKTSTFNISGKAWDSNKISKVVIENADGTKWGEVTFNDTAATNAKTKPSANNWSKEFTVNTSTHAQDGTYTFKIYAVDAANRKSSEIERTIIVDTRSPALTIETPADDNTYKNTNAIDTASIRFEGEIEEANSLSGVYYQIKANNGAQNSIPTDSDSLDSSNWLVNGFKPVSSYGTTSWKINQNFIEGTTSTENALCEGQNYKLYVYAVDKAGNVSTVQTRTFDVDRNDPVIATKLITDTEESLTDNTPKISTTSNFTFNYVASDTYGLAETNGTSLTVTKDGTELTATAFTDSNGTVTLNSGADGLYTFTVTATDKVGKTTTVTRNIRLDTVGPDITIATGLSGYQTNANITVNGTAKDASGVEAIYYSFAESAPDNLSLWTAITDNPTSWSIPLSAGTDGEVKTLHLRAKDVNGNLSEITTKTIKYDLANPTLTETGAGTSELKVKKSNSSFTLTGSVSDTNGIMSLTITDEDNNSYTHNLNLNAAELYSCKTATTWTVTCPVGNSDNKVSDGTHTFTITATDAAGKTETLKRTVIVDTKLPTLTLKALPDKNEMLSTLHQTTFTGTADDGTNGSGISEIELTITDASNNAGTNPASVTKTVTGTTSWLYSLDFTSDDWKNVFAKQGNKKITLKVTDEVGNENTEFKFADKTVNVKEFIYDNFAPETEITTSIGQYMKKSGFTISGSVTDTFGFTSLTVKEYTDGTETTGRVNTVTTTQDSTDKSKYTWSVPVPLRAKDDSDTAVEASDGKYKYEFIATDSAGHSTTLTTKEITVDTKAPDITEVLIDSEAYKADKWYKSDTLTLSVEAADNGTTGVSGMATVQYSIDNGTTWTSLSPKNGKYQGVVQFTGTTAAKKLMIRASDNADNVTYFDGTTTNGIQEEKSITVKVDTTGPDVKAAYYQIGNNTPVAIIENTETIYVNNVSTEKVTFYGLYEDGQSGVQALTIDGVTIPAASITYSTDDISTKTAAQVKTLTSFTTMPTDDTTTVKSWKAEFTPTTEGSFKISVKGENNAKTTSKHEFTMIRDVTAPSVPTFTLEEVKTTGTGESATTTYIAQYKDKDGNYFVNNENSKKFRLSGIASDKYGIASVTLNASSDIAGETFAGSNEDWAFTGFTISKTDGNEASITGSVTDNAGNITPISLTVKVDNKAPNGLHVIDANNKDLYFRIGTNNNTQPSTLTEADKDVGGKYSYGTYGNDNTIKIRGKFDDTGSGVRMIYYKLYHTDPETIESFKTENAFDNAKLLKDVISSESPTTGDTAGEKGSIKPLDTNESKRVYYTGTADSGTLDGKLEATAVTKHNGSVYYTTIESNFSASISGFTTNQNYLVLVVEDNVGNKALDIAKDVPYEGETKDFSNFILNVDNNPPAVVANPNFERKYISGKEDVVIWGRATDNAAGIDSVKLTIEGKDITTTESNYGKVELKDKSTDTADDGEACSSTNAFWKATIKAKAFENLTRNDVSVLATVTDKAGTGNSAVGTAATFVIGVPVTINAPSDADKYTDEIQVNGTISLSGNAADTTSLDKHKESLILYYTRSETLGTKSNITKSDLVDTGDASSKYVKLQEKANGTSWNFTGINTVSLKEDDAAEATQDVWFLFVSEDAAGNLGYSTPRKVTVDPQSDRPVISFTNALSVTESMDASHPEWIKQSQIRGNIEDDDGVAEVKYSFTGNDDDWTNVSYQASSKEFTIDLPTNGTVDNKRKLYFKVKESGTNKEYISAATAAANPARVALTTPKILTSNNTILNNTPAAAGQAANYNSIIHVSIDLVDPELEVLAYTFDDCATVTDLYNTIVNENGIINSESISWKPLTSNIKIGGPAEKLYILASAFDANKITSIVLKDGTTRVTAKKEKVFGTNDTRKAALYEIDVSEIETTEKSFTVEVTDGATKTINKPYKEISIDRVGPTVTINSPVANDTVYGNDGVADNRVKIMGSAEDSHGNNGIGKVWLAITKSESDSPKTEDAADAKECEKYFEISTQNVSAIVATFNGNIDDANNGKTERYLERFNYYVNELYGQGTSYNTDTDRIDICLWIKAEDTLGNVGEPFKLPLTILTQGDKPEVKITYPTQNSTKGGAITLTGSTSIGTDTVDKVYVQIDPDYGTSFATDWKNKLSDWIGERQVGYTIDSTGLTGDYADAIEAQGTPESWYLTLNMLNELNKTDENGKLTNSTIGIRVFAVGKENHKLSAPKELQFTLDPGSPIFGNTNKMRLVQYVNNGTGTGAETASLLYSDNIWLKGKWWLTGSVEDDSGIGTLTLVGSGTATGQSLLSGYATKITGSDKDNYVINVPVGDGFFGPTFTINAKEKEGSNTSPYNVKLQFDGEAPEFSANLAEAGNSIVQSQGTYQIDGTFNDGQGSGFNRIVFYIKRTIGDKDYLTDVMSRQGTTTGVPENCYPLSGFTLDGGLYWNSISGCTANNTQITLPAAIPAYVHAGSICRINNVIYLIKSTNPEAKTIMLDKQLASGTVTVDFTVAHVIDNTVSETGVTTYYGDTTNIIANDDGDEMVESYTSSSGKWTVAINSQNIKDGVIKMHFVAFDAAGNATAKEYEGTVANNRPRIAGVKFGSDTNGNGKVDEATETSDYTEMKTMYVGLYNSSSANKVENVSVNGQAPNGNKIYELAIPNNGVDIKKLSGNPVLTVKGKVKVVPEVVGGNDGLSWTYCVGEKNDNKIITETKDGKTVRKITEMASTHSDDIRAEETPIELSVADLISALGDSGDGQKDFFFQIWDHTAETEIGYSSNRADLALRFYIALNDGVDPTASIKPFYWKDSENNSLVYEGSGSERKAEGHIELEADLPDSNFASSGEFDKDPKVSGEIYLEGTAKDNVAVDEIWLKFDGLTSNTETNNFILVAKRESGAWANKSTTTGITFISAEESTESENGQDFNVVNWKIKIDTAEITGKADVDKKIQIMVKDRGGVNSDGTFGKDVRSSSVVNENQTAIPAVTWGDAKVTQNVQFYLDWDLTKPVTNKIGSTLANTDIVYQDNRTPTYQVDVVPYITGLVRGTDDNSNTDKFNTNRARSGAVSLRRGDILNKINGFNLNGGTTTTGTATTYVQIASNKDGSSNAVNMTNVAISGADLTFTVPDTAKSGYLNVVVNNVKALNNLNGYKDYNTENNEDAFDLKTVSDDRYIHIWRVTKQDTFKGSQNAVYPAMTSNNGTLYASFTNYGQSKTYYTSSFIGNGTVGVSSSTTGTSDGVTTVFNGYDPPEETDISVDSNGGINVFYAANYHGGNDYQWGNNTYHSGWYRYNDNDPENAGGIYVYDTAATSTYFGRTYHNAYRFELFTYDNELNQFKNIRVKRTNLSSTAYVNVAYYDKLTGAIKYSYATGGTDTSTNALPWVVIDGKSDVTDDSKLVPDHKTGDYNTFSFAGTWNKPTVLTDARYRAGGVTRSDGTGESLALTTTAAGYPIILYMDAKTGEPRIAFAKSRAPNTADDWTVQGVFASGDANHHSASDYMACEIDSEGYLHIAFQNTKGQLVYGKSTNNPTDGATKYTFGASQVLDDSGLYIDMTMKGTTPYISYLSRVNSYDGMKIAFLDSNFDADNDGVADTNGGWETLTAAMDAKVTSVRTCIEPNAKANDGTAYTAAIGYCPGLDYRAAFYVGQ